MYREYSLDRFYQMIKVIMGEIRKQVIFHQVNIKKFCDKSLEMVETDL